MSGETVPINVSKIESSEPRLFPDNYNQRNLADESFEQKLKLEQARLGLLFSPLAQLPNLFFSQNLPFNNHQLEKEFNTYLTLDQPKVITNNYSQPQHPAPSASISSPQSTPQIFESQSTIIFNRQLLQSLLYQTNWLVPNLEAQPPFYQAFLEGKLEPKLDLQFLVDQIVSQAKLVREKGRTELTLSLKPENLGEILLVLTSRLGIISIDIQAPPETKKLLEAELEELKKALKKAKVTLDKIQIEEVQRYA